MKVVHLSTYAKGGAGVAAMRLHRGLLGAGHDSWMVVREGDTEEGRTAQFDPAPEAGAIGYAQMYAAIQSEYIEANRTSLSNTWFSLPYPGVDVSRVSPVWEADVVNLHWVARFQSPATLRRLASLGKPLIWTMHDQWPFTGGCHYTGGCVQYRSDCGYCPQLHEDPLGLPRAVLGDRIELLKGTDLVLVSPSRWLAACVTESSALGHCRVEVIPNGLDTRVFAPQDRHEAKRRLNLEPEKVTLLFGAADGREKRKGLSVLRQALEHAMHAPEFRVRVESGEIVLLTMGQVAETDLSVGVPVRGLGWLSTDEALVGAYSASDIFLAPTLEDNLPNGVLEAMACGSCPLGFSIGGLPDMVEHGRNGFLAKPAEAACLADLLIRLVSDRGMRVRMGEASRERVLADFTVESHVERYAGLYEELKAKVAGGMGTRRGDYVRRGVKVRQGREQEATLDVTCGRRVERVACEYMRLDPRAGGGGRNESR